MTSGMRNKRIRRAGPAAGLALILATVAGCSSDGGNNEEPIDTGGSSSPSPDAEGGEGDEADLAEFYAAYWDALVELENSEELNVELLDGFVTGELLEGEVSRLRDFRANGLSRSGEPVIEDVTITVDEDTARIESCKSEEGWDVVTGGEVIPNVVPEELLAFHPYVVTLERTSEGWLINETLPQEEATISCS
ncbi:hypothetical protein HUT13_12345 [Streptomyces harbinensis]|uniref:hypothetical protein n=1 Tax=Streptomyces harbinensis TaxID=1176198 RepID=UPI001590A911|nr:hypothetical protein [Streptomyces harbinensis]QKV69486.1 hypothetical protein HUT13_12345 [Streptomyces harbinensis]